MPFNLAFAPSDFGKGGGPTFSEIGDPSTSLGDSGEKNIAVPRNHRRASQRRMKNSFGVWHFRPFPPHLQHSRDRTLARARFFLAKLNLDHLRCDNDPVNEPFNQFSIGNAWAPIGTALINMVAEGLCYSLLTWAQAYPTRPVHLIVGYAVLADPVGLGFVASEARPSGNVTGIAPYVKGLPAKQLELAREVVPGAMRIGLVDDVNDPKAHPQRREIEAAGKDLEVKIVLAEVGAPSDIGSAFDALAAASVEVVIVEQSNMLIITRKQIAEAAVAKKLPTVYGYRENVEAGGLISYGVDLNSCFHRAAYYVDKILKGAKPGNLPVEFPTNIELVINLRTARALGITIPPTLRATADEIIE